MNDAYIINDFLSEGTRRGLLPGARVTQDEERPSSKQMGTQSGRRRAWGMVLPQALRFLSLLNTLTSASLDTQGLWAIEMNMTIHCS